MKIAYSYRRFSQASQEMGHSLRRQADTAKAWCDLNGYTLSNRVFADKGKSAFKGENFKDDGALNQFIKLHEEGQIEKDCILCIDSADRFSRLPTAKAVKLFLDVIYSGIRIAFTGSLLYRDVIDIETIEKNDSLLTEVMGELRRAYRESAEKSRKVKLAIDERRESIKSGTVLNHNNVPKYFKFIPEEKFGKGWKGRYVKHPVFAPYVYELIEGILAGRSMYEMAQDFNKREIPTFRRSFEWHRNSIRQILRNRCLIGEYLGVKNYVEPYVDETTFLKVQNILNQNKALRGTRATTTNIFKGLMFCAECGKAFVVGSGEYKGVSYRYFRCSNYGKKNECQKVYFRAYPIEEEFFRDFIEKNPYSLVNEEDRQELKQIRADIATKTARQVEIGKELEGLAVLVKDVASIPEFKARIVKLQKEREQLKASIDELTAKVAAIQDIQDDSRGLTVNIDGVVYNNETLNMIYQALDDNKVREKIRVFLPLIIGKIVVDSRTRRFHVFNRAGREVYRSRVHNSNNNATSRWRESIKSWKKRKLANGRVIDVKRYQSRYYKSTLGVPTPA